MLLPFGIARAEDDLIELAFSGQTVTLEVARTPEEHAKGLSGREKISFGSGMVFDFAQPRPTCFWMRNTLVPLDAVFVSASGQVLQISQMQPQSLEQHCVGDNVRWVLEFPTGWMQEAGIDLQNAQLGEANLKVLIAIK